jgi:site-specific DNA-methyltransferase (adenine-specific)
MVPETAPASPNLLVSGDCLGLPQALTDYTKTDSLPIDVAYLDPPFNTGGHFGARLGAGTKRGHVAKTSAAVAYKDTFGSIEDFLAMLRPRLAVVRALLRPTGTLLLHLPPEVAHDAKVLCDSLFSREAYLGEIVWAPGNGARGKRMPSNHHLIFAYVADAKRRGDAVWNADDPALREPYAETSRAMHFTNVDESGRRYRERIVAGKAYRYFEDAGRLRGSIWTDLPAMLANTPLRKEGTGYPTQKPLALLDRLLRATSRPGDRVLDPMCGSGTTLVAAHALGRSFVGNDLGALALATTSKRLDDLQIPFAKVGTFPAPSTP